MAVQKIDAIDRFLNQYKSLELYLRMAYGDGMTVLGYEDKLDTEQGDKLRICRVMRNFLQHNPSAYGFVIPTEAMIVFLEELVTDLAVKLEKSEPAVYRLPPVKLTGTMRDAGKLFVKTGMSWLPVVDGKNYVVAVLTRDKLIELMAGTGRWEDALEFLFRPKDRAASLGSVRVAADVSEAGTEAWIGTDVIVLRGGKYSGVVRVHA